MPLKKPSSVQECVYFTNRIMGSGSAVAWVFKKQCPKCKKGIMGKPQKSAKIKDFRDAKNQTVVSEFARAHSHSTDFLAKPGKIDKKSDHYVCYSCGYQESNEQAENSLVLNVEYKCPYCGHEGETTSEYKRKTFEGVPSYVFECEKCHKKIGITKKLKEPKKKKENTQI